MKLTSLLLPLVVLIGAAVLGLFRPADNAFVDLRFNALNRPPSGNIVFVEIDGKSLSEIGVWPWPRRIHAELLDKLMELGAGEVAFDIDFSASSTPKDDALFAAALERSGGYASLAAFRQTTSPAGGYNLPLDAFAKNASIVAVEVPVEAGGVIRSYPMQIAIGGKAYPSVGVSLSGAPIANRIGMFDIDFGIDISQVDRISAVDLLDGKIDRSRLAGKNVVIGASAAELRDLFVVPRIGIVPGGLLHVVAAETLLQHRALGNVGPWPIALLIVLMGVAAAMLEARLARSWAIVGVLALGVTFEILALALQAYAALLFDTAALQIALASLVCRAFVLEIGIRRRAQAAAVRERESMRLMLERVVADNFDGVVVLNERRDIVAASHMAEELLGDGLVGQNARGLLPHEVEVQIERAFDDASSQTIGGRSGETTVDRQGRQHTIEYAFTTSVIGVEQKSQRVGCLTFRDITARRDAENRLTYLARHDPLTGAWARTTLVDHMSELGASGIDTTVLLVDLKRFNTINETLGHAYGDKVLQEVASRLREAGLTSTARLGGDNFAVVIAQALSTASIRARCDDLFQSLGEPFDFDDHHALVGVSIGVTTSELSTADPQLMLSHAAMAHSVAKLQVGNCFITFDPAMDRRLVERRNLELELRQAMARNELAVHYQPQVSMKTGAPVAAEALLRWQHADKGYISPATFIPLAEETGFIVELGRWVLRTACQEAAIWPAHIRLAVNFSPVQFELTDVVSEVRLALTQSGLAPERLDVEITEGIFLAGSSRIEVMLQGLRALGVGIALDDFGTGFSSLGYISRLPIDKIKIDQSFVRKLPDDTQTVAVISAILALSQSLDRAIVVEGVESEQQAELLRSMGCDIAQGFHFARPMSAPDVRSFLLPPERRNILRLIG